MSTVLHRTHLFPLYTHSVSPNVCFLCLIRNQYLWAAGGSSGKLGAIFTAEPLKEEVYWGVRSENAHQRNSE